MVLKVQNEQNESEFKEEGKMKVINLSSPVEGQFLFTAGMMKSTDLSPLRDYANGNGGKIPVRIYGLSVCSSGMIYWFYPTVAPAIKRCALERFFNLPEKTKQKFRRISSSQELFSL